MQTASGIGSERVLAVDDEVEFLRLMGLWLEKAGYEPILAEDGVEALRKLYQLRPSLVVMDLMMPRLNGYETCRRIREMSSVPIIILSVRNDKADILRGFDAGADDYLVKPFEFSELSARIKAVLRRAKASIEIDGTSIFTCDDLTVDFGMREVLREGQPLPLSPKEFDLLSCLIRNQGRVMTPERLLTNVWGSEYRGEKSYVKLYIRYLRRKIEPNPDKPKYILTRRGAGYFFTKELEAGKVLVS